MFQFRRFPSSCYGFTKGWRSIALTGFPIRISADLCLFAAPRSFSQLITSFVGSKCQGILPTLLLAWSLKWSSIFLTEFFVPFDEISFSRSCRKIFLMSCSWSCSSKHDPYFFSAQFASPSSLSTFRLLNCSWSMCNFQGSLPRVLWKPNSITSSALLP